MESPQQPEVDMSNVQEHSKEHMDENNRQGNLEPFKIKIKT